MRGKLWMQCIGSGKKHRWGGTFIWLVKLLHIWQDGGWYIYFNDRMIDWNWSCCLIILSSLQWPEWFSPSSFGAVMICFSHHWFILRSHFLNLKLDGQFQLLGFKISSWSCDSCFSFPPRASGHGPWSRPGPGRYFKSLDVVYWATDISSCYQKHSQMDHFSIHCKTSQISISLNLRMACVCPNEQHFWSRSR